MPEEKIYVETQPCMHCGQRGIVTVLAREYDEYLDGAYIQVAFPNLDKALREQIQTGTHPTCWNLMFGSEEDQ